MHSPATTVAPPADSGPQLPRQSGSDRAGAGAVRAFGALLWRDVFVTGRELVAFLAQVILQPLFLLFVFGKVLGDLGYTQDNFAQVLLPGVIAFTAFLTALQNVAFPLVIDFSYTKEIEDRLMAPLPTSLVAVEKVVFATLRALIAAVLMFPLGYWVLGEVSITWGAVPAVAMFLVLGALVGAAVGLTLGTLVTASKINLVFAIVLTPLLFTGSTQFPWVSLDDLRWFQVICAFNPLTYVSEGMRAEMLPSLDHIPTWVSGLALLGYLLVFMTIGIKGFLRRAID